MKLSKRLETEEIQNQNLIDEINFLKKQIEEIKNKNENMDFEQEAISENFNAGPSHNDSKQKEASSYSTLVHKLNGFMYFRP